MKTRLLSLTIACLVLASLAGTLYWSNRHPKTSSTPLVEPAGPTILKIDPANVTAFTVKAKNAPPVSLARDKNQVWQITAPKPMLADPDQVSMLLFSLSPLVAQQVVADRATNLQQYGLDAPSVEIDFTEKGRPDQKLFIGDPAPVGNGSYAMLANDPRIFTTLAGEKTTLDKTANDLRDKRLITLNPGQMASIELIRNGVTIMLAHNASRWVLQKPAPYRTDSDAASALVTAVTDAAMQSTQPSEKEAAADFANGTPVATVKVSGAKGTETLEVRKGNTSDFVRSSAVPGIYQADLSLSDSLSKAVDDLRSKQLFDFKNAEPDAIDLEIAGAKASSVVLVHNAQGWWRNSRKMDDNSVESLVSGFRDLTATGFGTSGFTTPAIVATVTSDPGNAEKVEIAKLEDGKSGTRYLGRRAGDPSLYMLDPGAVEGIESAAAAIKPTAK